MCHGIRHYSADSYTALIKTSNYPNWLPFPEDIGILEFLQNNSLRVNSNSTGEGKIQVKHFSYEQTNI